MLPKMQQVHEAMNRQRNIDVLVTLTVCSHHTVIPLNNMSLQSN